ncbi:MAG: DNA-3-methyladenine glycosylase I [Flavobacteriales bacterium]|nr:DNA-3-methyladenine glycosylase I [Flavobacteriales bacterium]
MNKIPENTYCHYALQQAKDDVHRVYHDTEYGFPLTNDDQLFGRLVLEINQAGLSWTTILNKKENFVRAYSNFEISVVASYGEADVERLLHDAGIIRNKLKLDAAIHNAQRIQELQREFGSFKSWLDHHKGLSKPEWVKLFKKTFKFTGGEITGEFLMSTGYLPGSHHPNCPVYKLLH